MQQITTIQYSDQFAVGFTNDAWFNATAVAKNYDKRPNDWLSLESTKEYIMALHAALFPEIQLPEKMVIKQNQLLKTKTGSQENGGGAWFHPKLAVAFARWLDVKFAVWCDLQTEKMLFPKRNALVDLPPAYLTPAMKRHINKRVNWLVKNQVGTTYYTIAELIRENFNVNKRELIPLNKYAELCTLLGCEPDPKALQGELLEPLKVEYQPPAGMALVDVAELENLRRKKPFQIFKADDGLVQYTAEDLDKNQFAMIPLEKWKGLPAFKIPEGTVLVDAKHFAETVKNAALKYQFDDLKHVVEQCGGLVLTKSQVDRMKDVLKA
jgi:KilA-N domain